MRTSELAKRPIVTLAGEDVAQIKDVVFSAGGGAVGGFTLAGRGLFAGPAGEALPWAAVIALGSDAVMIDDASALQPQRTVLDDSAASGGSGGDVIGSQALTDSGTDLGRVVDVIIEVQGARGGRCDVIGYEIEASEALGTKGTRVLIPLPDTLAASGEHLILPAAAKDYVSDDLAGFGAAVEAFRVHLSEGR